LFEGIALEIGEANSQPHGSEPLRRREPDPAGSTGHEGESPFGERGMFSHGHSYLGNGHYLSRRRVEVHSGILALREAVQHALQ
jgi:hypothetical protein